MSPKERWIRDQLAALDRERKPLRGYYYSSPPAFALEHGKLFAPTLPLIELPKGEPRRSFHNCLMVAIKPDQSKVDYVEGWAGVPGQRPIHHAWLSDAHGRAMDITLGFRPQGAYFGVVIPKGQLIYGVGGDASTAILDDWTGNWPILKERWAPDDEIEEALGKIIAVEGGTDG